MLREYEFCFDLIHRVSIVRWHLGDHPSYEVIKKTYLCYKAKYKPILGLDLWCVRGGVDRVSVLIIIYVAKEWLYISHLMCNQISSPYHDQGVQYLKLKYWYYICIWPISFFNENSLNENLNAMSCL